MNSEPGLTASMRMRGAAALLAAALLCSGAAGALPPRPDGPVADLANILDAATRDELDGLIRQTREKNGAVLVIATVPSLEDMTVEDYAVKLFKSWGIGEKDKNNGILLLVAPTEHKVRIEVGYGLEGILPDGRCGDIIRTDIVPAFKRGAPAEGVLAGARAIVDAVGGKSSPTETGDANTTETDSALPIWGILVLVGSAFLIGLTFGWTERGWRWAVPLCALLVIPATYAAYLVYKTIEGALWVVSIVALTSGEHIGSGRIIQNRRRGGSGWTSGGFGGFTGGFSSGGGGGGSFGGFGGGFSGGGGSSGSW